MSNNDNSRHIWYLFDPRSYEVRGPYNYKEAAKIQNRESALQILKLVVDEFGKLV